MSEAVDGRALLLAAPWLAKQGQAGNAIEILSRFLPELFGDEATFNARRQTEHLRTYIHAL